MKRFLLMMTASVLIFSACSDDDEATTYEQSEFYGTWELSSSTSTDYTPCPDNPPTLNISASELIIAGVTTDGCSSGVNTPIEYTFNGSAFIINFGVDYTYKITSKSENEFSWNEGVENETETWVRVN